MGRAHVRSTWPFPAHGADCCWCWVAVSCDGEAPTTQAAGQTLFNMAVKYTTTDDAVFNDPCAATPAGVVCSRSPFDNNRAYASSTAANFSFFDEPVIDALQLSANAELVPGTPLSPPSFDGTSVYVPATGDNDTHTGSLLALVGTGFDNGAAADKAVYRCQFVNSELGVVQTTAATFVSNELVECTTPDFGGLEAAGYEVSVSMNGQHWSSTGKVVQTFSAVDITPSFAAVQGAVHVEVEVLNGGADVGAVYCRFGDWLWPPGTADGNAPTAGPAQEATNTLQVPLAGSTGDVVSATYLRSSVGAGSDFWRCPVPDIEAARAIKPRNAETPVRLSYDGKAWTNRVNLFFYEQPDVSDPSPPIGPTRGGTLITLPLSEGRDYHLRADDYAARCLFSELRGAQRTAVAPWLDADGVQHDGWSNATFDGSTSSVQLACETPPNPQPGSSYDVDVSLDGGVTWAYAEVPNYDLGGSSAVRSVPDPPEFSYYAETAIITEDIATNYNAQLDFRG